jgi:hypothetical protein
VSLLPFYGLAPLLSAHHRASLVNVARSTAALHAPDDTERITWEQAGLLATAADSGHVAAISRHMRDHLAASYHIPAPAIADLINGLTRAGQDRAGGPAAGLPAAARHRFLPTQRIWIERGFTAASAAGAAVQAGS